MSIIKRFSLPVLWILLASFGVVSTPSEEEYVRFDIKNAGLTVEGSFTKFSAQIKYDPARSDAASFIGEIDVASIKTGISLRDDHLKKEEYFHQQLYPKITFRSTKVTPTTDGFKVVGNLTIKGTSKSITLNVKRTIKEKVNYLYTELELNRLDFNVGESSWVLSDDVRCFIRVKM
jgi:polyisoprenoid-binding protein YceI